MDAKSKARIDDFYTLQKKAKTRLDKEELQLQIKSDRMGSKIIEVHKLKKRFGEKVIVDGFDYVFKKGDRVGIAGRNGSGKTTFLNMLMGKVEPDSGKIVIGETVQLGYYSQQGLHFKEGKRVIEVVKDIAEVIPLEKGRKITASQLLERFLFSPKQQYDYVEKLSGGEKKRLYLLTVLMGNPNFLILDEPTNDLDIKTIGILEDFLEQFSGCLLLVSHDRAFMDRLADQVFYFKGQGEVIISNEPYSRVVEDFQKVNGSTAKVEKGAAQSQTQDRYADRLSYQERREYNKLEKEIEKLETEIRRLSEEMSQAADLPVNEQMEKANRLGEYQKEVEEKTDRWLSLSERA